MKKLGLIIIGILTSVMIGCGDSGNPPGQPPGVAPIPPYPPGAVTDFAMFAGHMKTNPGWSEFVKKHRYNNPYFFCWGPSCPENQPVSQQVTVNLQMDRGTTEALERGAYSTISLNSYSFSQAYQNKTIYMTNDNTKFRIENIMGNYGTESWDKEVQFVFNGRPEDPQVSMDMYYDGNVIGTAILYRSGTPGVYPVIPTPYGQGQGLNTNQQGQLNNNPNDVPGGYDPQYQMGNRRWW